MGKHKSILFLILLFGSAVALKPASQSKVSDLFSELQTKRENVPGLHQEFEIEQAFKGARGTASSKRTIVLDMSQGKWRETTVSGSGTRIRIFDGTEFFALEQGDSEYVQTKRESKELPQPAPYTISLPNWSKAKELQRLPCGLSNNNDQCVLLEIPLNPSMQSDGSHQMIKMTGGAERMLLDVQTGLLISSRTIQTYDNSRGGYQSDITYTLKRMSWGTQLTASLFALPPGDLKEVKQLSSWDAPRIKKQLAGTPAPELSVTDLRGKSLTLAGLKGKIVLLDFWTTWCGPCRADGPALDRLYHSYGDKDLAIIGISVSEDRPIVEKFLSEHPHAYPIVLTSENEMPRAYQISAFPTYIVIDRDGTVATAVEGDKGFAELQKLLKKAGLEVQ